MHHWPFDGLEEAKRNPPAIRLPPIRSSPSWLVQAGPVWGIGWAEETYPPRARVFFYYSFFKDGPTFQFSTCKNNQEQFGIMVNAGSLGWREREKK